MAGYRILGVLGAGGMGRVYLGRSPSGRLVAVKVIRPELADDRNFRRLFRREVAAVRRVGGAWTAPVIDADTESDRPWLVTGYVPGPSVFEAVDRYGPLPEDSVRALGAGLAEALVAIHDASIVHRDLKPTNVLLSTDGPRVIDFGISRAMDATSHTRPGAAVGSPGFMSPEQIDGRDVGFASDVFSFGSVLTFALAGRGPFGVGTSQVILYRILSKEPDLSAVPPGLRDLIASCLAKYTGNRPTPREILAELAPHGTAALLKPTWLPGPLTERLSRRAEALPSQFDGRSAAWEPSGPWAVAGTGEEGSTTEAPSLFDVPSFAGRASGASEGVPAWAAGFADAPRQATPTSVTARASAPPEPGGWTLAPPPPARRPDDPSFPGSSRRGRALLAVSAVCAVAVGVAAVLVLLPEDGGAGPAGAPWKSTTQGPSSRGPSVTPAATTPSSSPPESVSAPPGAVPAAYIGTWKGTVRTELARTPSEYTLTLHAPTSDGVVAHSVSIASKPADILCVEDSKVVRIDTDGVWLKDIPNTKPDPSFNGHPACAHDNELRIRLNPDGTLFCEILGPNTAHPSGILTRQKT